MRQALLSSLTGQGVALPLIVFALTSIVVAWLASRLARQADAVADATGLGRIWIGSLLLAAATSLPELVTDTSSAVMGVPDIGVGDILGSTLSNMLILAALDLAYARRLILQRVAVDHALVGTLGAVLLGIAGVAISVGGLGQLGPVGVESLLILGVYLFGMHAVYRGALPPVTAPSVQMELGDTSTALLRRSLRGMALAAVAMLAFGPLLVITAEAVAQEAGLSQSLVGTALLGLATSFPELVSTVAAVRMGALDLAVGNIFGSNAFNLCIVPVMDLAYAGPPVLASVSAQHAATAQIALLCISLGITGILARAQRRIAIARIESLLIVASCAGAVWLLARS